MSKARLHLEGVDDAPRPARERRNVVRGTSYDSAQTTPNNARHWAPANGMSPVASNSESVRDVLRRRSRYEFFNNPYAKGIVNTVVDDTIGTGPRLQVITGRRQSKTDQLVEQAHQSWFESQDGPEKLRLMRKTKIISGEVFAHLGNSSAYIRPDSIYQRSRVNLGITLIEPDQVQTPGLFQEGAAGQVSGIEYDRYGNPSRYHVLREHPGDNGAGIIGSLAKYNVPADQMIHYFCKERPGDARGIPELTPALPLFAVSRRFMLATLEAAEHISNIAAIAYTDAPGDGEAAQVSEFDEIDLVRNMMMFMPEGWKVEQPKPEQPVSTFAEFRKAILAEIARTLKIPYNIAAGDSSDSNYASARIDYQPYWRGIFVERKLIKSSTLDPMFWSWFDEAVRVGAVPPEARTIEYASRIKTRYYYDGQGYVDDTKEARGQQIRLESGMSSKAIEAAKQGLDWRELMDQQKAEQDYADEIGLRPPVVPGAAIPEQPKDSKDGDDDKSDSEELEESKKGDADE